MKTKDLEITKLKKENEAIKIEYSEISKKFFEQEEDYYKPVRVDNFYSNNYSRYKSNSR